MLRVVITFVAVSAAFAISSSASCGVIRVVDQENNPAFPVSLGSVRFAGGTIAQEFWPTLSGIDAVELRMLDRGIGDTAGADVFVRVRWFSLTGPIVGTSHLVHLPDMFGTTGDSDVVPFTFPNPIVFSPDQPYFIEVNQLRGDNFHVAFTGIIDHYARGRMWEGYPTAVPLETDDLWFRTGIVPEPGSWNLMVAGLCAFFAWFWTGRSGRRQKHDGPIGWWSNRSYVQRKRVIMRTCLLLPARGLVAIGSLACTLTADTIVFADDAPIYDFLSSTSAIRTPFRQFLVAGSTEAGSSVSINGAPIAIDAQGNFSVPFGLNPGQNPLAITIVPTSGETQIQMRSVFHDTAISTAGRELVYVDLVRGDSLTGPSGTAVIDPVTRDVIGFLPNEHVRGILPNQREVYFASRKVLSTATHQLVRTLPFSSEIPTNSFLVSPQGDRLYSKSEVVNVASNLHDATLPIDITTGDSFGGASIPGGPAISPDGATICAGNTVRCVEVGSGNVVNTGINSSTFLSDLAFSPDGKYLFVSDYAGSGRLQVRDYPSFELTESHFMSDFAGEIGFLSDGTVVVGSSGNPATALDGGVSTFSFPPPFVRGDTFRVKHADNLTTTGNIVYASTGSNDPEAGERYGINVLESVDGTLQLNETYFLGVNAWESSVGRPRQDQIRQIVHKSSFTVLDGDYNANGVVDAADYVLWRDSLGKTGTSLLADGNGNNQIDNGDYTHWKLHFGQSAASYSASNSSSDKTSVPEPHAGLMLLTAALGMSSYCSSRRRH